MATLFFPGREIRGDAKSYGPASPEDVKFSLDASISGEAIRVASSPRQSGTISWSTAEAGLAIGDTITAIEGMPVEQVVRDIAPKCLTNPDPAVLC